MVVIHILPLMDICRDETENAYKLSVYLIYLPDYLCSIINDLLSRMLITISFPNWNAFVL